MSVKVFLFHFIFLAYLTHRATASPEAFSFQFLFYLVSHVPCSCKKQIYFYLFQTTLTFFLRTIGEKRENPHLFYFSGKCVG